MKTKNVDSFYFNKASYFLGDVKGNRVLMKVNYNKNKFNVDILERKDDNIINLRHEADVIARDLLMRKSRVNFVERQAE